MPKAVFYGLPHSESEVYYDPPVAHATGRSCVGPLGLNCIPIFLTPCVFGPKAHPL